LIRKGSDFTVILILNAPLKSKVSRFNPSVGSAVTCTTVDGRRSSRTPIPHIGCGVGGANIGRVSNPTQIARQRLSCSDDHLVVQTAVVGQGLELIRDDYAGGDLHSTKLVRVLSGSRPRTTSSDIASVTEAGRSVVSRLATRGGAARNGSSLETCIMVGRTFGRRSRPNAYMELLGRDF
jgi:hypothetical protein